MNRKLLYLLIAAVVLLLAGCPQLTKEEFTITLTHTDGGEVNVTDSLAVLSYPDLKGIWDIEITWSVKDLNGFPSSFVMLIERQTSGEFTGLVGPEGTVPDTPVEGSVEESGDIEFSFMLESPVPTIPDLQFKFTGSMILVKANAIAGSCEVYEGKDLYRQGPFTAEKRHAEIVTASYGESITFTMHPEEGYQVDDVFVDWESVGPVSSYTFDSIDEDHFIHVKFRPEQPPELAWQKSFGGSDNDWARSVQQTVDGGFIVAGHTESNDGDVSGNRGGRDFWIVKLDGQGNLEWQQCLGGSDDDWASSVRQTTDGGFIVAGSTKSNDRDVSGNNGKTDAWIVKLDSQGILEWQKCLGGSDNDWASSVQQTTDGGFIVAGSTESDDGDVSGNHGSRDFWIVKLDSEGAIEWQQCLGGSNLDYAQSIELTNDGGFIVAGSTHSDDGNVSGNHGMSDFWIVKLDSEGVLEWQKCFGGSEHDWAHSVQQTADGGYILAGSTESYDGDVTGNHGGQDFWIVKLKEDGELEWQRCLGGSSNDTASAVQQTIDGGYIVSGYTESNDGDVSGNRGNSDYWLVKLSSSGDLLWQKCLGGSDHDYSHSLQQTTDGGYILAGSSRSNDGDVTGNQGDYDFWVVKLE